MKRGFLARMLALTGMSKAANAQGPDYSDVDSREKALELVRQGKLEKVHLFPLELGGHDVEVNIVYLPIGLGALKQQLDGTLMKMAQDGLVSQLTVEPAYKGNSFIPARIVMKGSHPDREGTFEPVLQVW